MDSSDGRLFVLMMVTCLDGWIRWRIVMKKMGVSLCGGVAEDGKDHVME